MVHVRTILTRLLESTCSTRRICRSLMPLRILVASPQPGRQTGPISWVRRFERARQNRLAHERINDLDKGAEPVARALLFESNVQGTRQSALKACRDRSRGLYLTDTSAKTVRWLPHERTQTLRSESRGRYCQTMFAIRHGGFTRLASEHTGGSVVNASTVKQVRGPKDNPHGRAGIDLPTVPLRPSRTKSASSRCEQRKRNQPRVTRGIQHRREI